MHRTGSTSEPSRSVGPVLIISGLFVIFLVVVLHFIDPEDFGFGHGFHDKLPHIVNVLAGLAVILVVSGLVLVCKNRFCNQRWNPTRTVMLSGNQSGIPMAQEMSYPGQPGVSVYPSSSYPPPGYPQHEPSQAPPAYGFTPSLYPQPTSSYHHPSGGSTANNAYAPSYSQPNAPHN